VYTFHFTRFVIGTVFAISVITADAFAPALAQAQNPDWFIPPQAQPQGQPRPSKPTTHHPTSAGPSPLMPSPTGQNPAPQTAAEAPAPAPQAPLPPAPTLPPLPKGAAPPAAVIGVLSVPDVMRNSTAAQEVERVIRERRDKLSAEAQKEQAAWRSMQEAMVNDRAKLSPEQIRARERQLQERITNAQRSFRERGKIIQDAAQYALAQIERTLIMIIRQVAESRGMNLVLHRAQVALNVNEFDITQEVTDQLNKVLPAVVIPPDGQEPSAALAKQGPAPKIPAAPAAARAAADATTPQGPAPQEAAPQGAAKAAPKQ